MADYGVTITGFIRKTQEQIQSDLETEWKNNLGQDQDISEDSPNAIIIGLVSEMADTLWQVAEDTYNSLNRNIAEGVPLQNAVSLVGITIKDQSQSTANVSFRGDNVTTIPADTQVKQTSTSLIFKTLEASKISSDSCNWIQLQINSILNSTPYRLYIDGNVYTYTSDSSATYSKIIAGLKAVIEDAEIGLIITDEGTGLMTIEADDKDDDYDISGSSYFTTGKVQTVIEVECVDYGSNEVSAESIIEISTAISGLDSVINYYEGETGTDIEEDQELRLRTQSDIAVSGFNFVDAIRAKLLNDVAGTSYCKVYENDTMETDANSIPAKSWEAVIDGGSDSNIAELLYKMKIAGMRSSGSETVEIKDDDGIPHNIRFTRPTNIYIWVKATINSYNDEEDFPAAGEAAIKAAMLTYSEKFNIGDVIVAQKFITPVFEVDGIGSVTITIASTSSADGVPSYSLSNINCTIRQQPNFDLSRMIVVL